jgi:hypothetical protein
LTWLFKNGMKKKNAENKNVFDNNLHFSIFDWLFTVLRPAQEYFTFMEMSPLLVKGCKI